MPVSTRACGTASASPPPCPSATSTRNTPLASTLKAISLRNRCDTPTSSARLIAISTAPPSAYGSSALTIAPPIGRRGDEQAEQRHADRQGKHRFHAEQDPAGMLRWVAEQRQPEDQRTGQA